MGFLEVTFLVLLVLKLLGWITISWWLVFLPLIIGLAISGTIIALFVNKARKVMK